MDLPSLGEGHRSPATKSAKSDAAFSGAGYPSTQFKTTTTTVFWVGEKATSANGYIPNKSSYWDPRWMENYGGVDDPNDRRGFLPTKFTPKENPFYVALPFVEVDEGGNLKPIAKRIPGYGHITPLTKGRWIEVRYNGKSCYGQWEDVGPFGEDDFEWVFGHARTPANTRGVGAGLDVSPAMATCLSLNGNHVTEWRLVSEGDVPAGPWRQIVSRN